MAKLTKDERVLKEAKTILGRIKTKVFKNPDLYIGDIIYEKTKGKDDVRAKLFAFSEIASKQLSKEMRMGSIPLGKFEQHKEFNIKEFFNRMESILA